MADDTVQRYWNMFETKGSTKAAAVGLADFLFTKYVRAIYSGRIWKSSSLKETAIACGHQ